MRKHKYENEQGQTLEPPQLDYVGIESEILIEKNLNKLYLITPFIQKKKLQLTRTKKLTNFTAKSKTSTKLDSNQTLVITIFLTSPLLILMKDHKYINEHTKKAL